MAHKMSDTVNNHPGRCINHQATVAGEEEEEEKKEEEEEEDVVLVTQMAALLVPLVLVYNAA